MTASRRPVYSNPGAKSWTTAATTFPLDLLDKFHQQLPGSGSTRLVRLDEVANELGVRAVYLKDESSRFSLPSFKILGASWATFRAICDKLGFALDADIACLKAALVSHPLTLFAATKGNHGRAVARMGAILSISVEIYVPSSVDTATIEIIRGEGANITVSTGSYDDAVSEAQRVSRQNGGILIQDFAFEGYEDIPKVEFPP